MSKKPEISHAEFKMLETRFNHLLIVNKRLRKERDSNGDVLDILITRFRKLAKFVNKLLLFIVLFVAFSNLVWVSYIDYVMDKALDRAAWEQTQQYHAFMVQRGWFLDELAKK